MYGAADGNTEYNAGETSCPYKKLLVGNRKPKNLYYFVTTPHSIFTLQLKLYVGVNVLT